MACEKQLTIEEQKKLQADFEYWQTEYNKTGDKMIVWDKLMPIFKDALGPAILKMNMHHFVERFDEKLENGVLTLVTRYIKNPDYHFEGTLATLCHYAALGECRKENVIGEESHVHLSMDELLLEEENTIHQEHILRTF